MIYPVVALTDSKFVEQLRFSIEQKGGLLVEAVTRRSIKSLIVIEFTDDIAFLM